MTVRTAAAQALLDDYPGLAGLEYGRTGEPIIEAIEREARGVPPEGTRLVLMSEALALELGASRVEWGEPDEHGWYTPTLYSDDRRKPAPA
jgi:hypothetical protein